MLWEGVRVRCTATLLAPNLVLTARHCYELDVPGVQVWVRGVRVVNEYAAPEADALVATLESPISEPPVPVAWGPTPEPGTFVVTYGYGCSGYVEAHHGRLLSATTLQGHACHGDSGGPVTSESGELIGTLSAIGIGDDTVYFVPVLADVSRSWRSMMR